MLQHIIPRDYQGRRPATGRSEIPHRGDAGGIGGKRNQSFEERRQPHTKKDIIPRDYQGQRPATGRSEIPHRGDAGGIGGKRNQSFEERRQLHKKKTS